jgi:2-octaprenyl-6-methoxyphenol hydroxylase
MGAGTNSKSEFAEVCVVGAGLNGLVAAKAFAISGFSVASLGPLERGAHGRTVALFGRSIALLKRIGVWRRVEAQAAPLRVLRIIDDTGSLFAPGPVEFQSAELGEDAFGWNIENVRLAEIVADALGGEPALRRRESRVARLAWPADGIEAIFEDGSTLAARFVVGADGRNSPTAKAAGLRMRAHAYPQSAMTLILSHSHPHEDVSTEFHTRQGPFTLVPLPAGQNAANRSSLVWLMSEAEADRRMALTNRELAREIEKQSRGLVGRVEIESPRGRFPMRAQAASRLTAKRVALIGDAAHAFPPIGAQGLNLGLRDVEGVVAAAMEAREAGQDIGGEAMLAAYARGRAGDIAIRTIAVNGLNLSLLGGFAPIDALRGAGLLALKTIGPLRRMVMREGLSPQWGRRAPV